MRKEQGIMKGLADRLAFISDRITAVLGNLCGAIVLIMGFLILFEVLMRYVVGRPPLLADELRPLPRDCQETRRIV